MGLALPGGARRAEAARGAGGRGLGSPHVSGRGRGGQSKSEQPN